MTVNPIPKLTIDELVAQYGRAGLPGIALAAPPGSVQAEVRQAQATPVMSLFSRCNDLSEQESFPPSSVELLPMWESVFGLPDPCTPLNPTVEQRQQALAARMAMTGGESRAAYIAVAAAYGAAITIDEFRPFRIGISSVDDGMADETWLFAWRINLPEDLPITQFAVGVSSVDDPLASWDISPLICTLTRLAPPHTTLFFNTVTT